MPQVSSLFYTLTTPQDSTQTLIYRISSLGLARNSQSWRIGFVATGWPSTSIKPNTIFHVPSKKIDVVPVLCFDNNLPDTPHNPSLVSELARIHNTHENPSSRSFKLLGIHLDENLSFNADTTALIGKLSRSIFFLNRVKHTLSQKALKYLYIPASSTPTFSTA